MTARLAEYLESQNMTVRRHDLSTHRFNGIARHFIQVILALKAGVLLLISPLAQVSLGCNGGLGMVYTALIASCARVRGNKVSLHHHSYEYIRTHSRLAATICKLGGKRMTHVFLSNSMAEEFTQQYPTGQESVVVPNALFVPAVQSVRLEQSGPINIGLISNLNREKGLDDFLEIAAILRTDLTVKMHLAGPAEHKIDRARIEAAVAAGDVIWHGALYGIEKDDFFEKLDLFLFPTHYRMEAQPTVIYEAFAAGVPVVAFDRGTIADQVRDNLAVVRQGDDFTARALSEIAALSARTAESRVELMVRARARHAEDTQTGKTALSRLFSTADGHIE